MQVQIFASLKVFISSPKPQFSKYLTFLDSFKLQIHLCAFLDTLPAHKIAESVREQRAVSGVNSRRISWRYFLELENGFFVGLVLQLQLAVIFRSKYVEKL